MEPRQYAPSHPRTVARWVSQKWRYGDLNNSLATIAFTVPGSTLPSYEIAIVQWQFPRVGGIYFANATVFAFNKNKWSGLPRSLEQNSIEVWASSSIYHLHKQLHGEASSKVVNCALVNAGPSLGLQNGAENSAMAGQKLSTGTLSDPSWWNHIRKILKPQKNTEIQKFGFEVEPNMTFRCGGKK